MQASLSSSIEKYIPQLEKARIWQSTDPKPPQDLQNQACSQIELALLEQHIELQIEEIQKVQKLVQAVSAQRTYFFSKRESLPASLNGELLKHSITIRSAIDKKTVFIALKKRIYPAEKRSIRKLGITVKEAVMLEFTSDNKFLSAKKIVKMGAEYEERNRVWYKSINRRISIMQKVAGCPEVPQNFAYIERLGQWRNKVELYQEAADYDLHTLFEMPTGLKSLNVEQKLTIAEDLISAVKYLHERRICHFDLKLENVLIFRTNDGAYRAKLTDFGLANYFDDEEFQIPGGTTMWAAPEVIFQEKISEKSDLWGLGHILFVVQNVFANYALSFLAGVDDIPQLRCRILDAYLHTVLNEMTEPPKTIEDLTDIANAMLLKDPEARLSVDEALRYVRSIKQNAKGHSSD